MIRRDRGINWLVLLTNRKSKIYSSYTDVLVIAGDKIREVMVDIARKS